jgi:glycosyltransferase involved in cell wall biosynthesis
LSEHAASAIAPMVGVPVVAVPPVVPVREGPPPARSTLGLADDAFVVLFTYDARGGTIRKNPEAAIDAYTQAFSPDDGCVLVLKSINASSQPGLLDRLRARAGGRPDVEIRDGYVTASEQAGLIASCDVYLSLHRAEGFGLTMADAMAAGRAVVATGWSGNLEFMDDDTARLVRYELEPVPDDAFPWPTGGARWARPDVDHAAELLRSLYDDRASARALGDRARASIAEHHSAAARARVIRTRLARLRRTRSIPRRALRRLRRALER